MGIQKHHQPKRKSQSDGVSGGIMNLIITSQIHKNAHGFGHILKEN